MIPEISRYFDKRQGFICKSNGEPRCSWCGDGGFFHSVQSSLFFVRTFAAAFDLRCRRKSLAGKFKVMHFFRAIRHFWVTLQTTTPIKVAYDTISPICIAVRSGDSNGLDHKWWFGVWANASYLLLWKSLKVGIKLVPSLHWSQIKTARRDLATSPTSLGKLFFNM